MSTPTEAQDTYNDLSVNEFFKQHVVKDDNGVYKIPPEVKEKLDPLKLELFTTEARRRTTESNFAKAKREKLALQAKLEAQSRFINVPTVDPEEQERLEELKHEDPDAWLREVTKKKEEAQREFEKQLAEAYNIELEKLKAQEKTQTLEEALQAFNANSQVRLTPENLEYDVPVRLTKQFEEGKLTTDEYLEKAAEFVGGGKVVKSPTPNTEPDFRQTTGGKKDDLKTGESLEDLYRRL